MISHCTHPVLDSVKRVARRRDRIPENRCLVGWDVALRIGQCRQRIPEMRSCVELRPGVRRVPDDEIVEVLRVALCLHHPLLSALRAADVVGVVRCAAAQHLMGLATSDIADLDVPSRPGTPVPHVDDRAVQPDPDRLVCSVEHSIVDTCGTHILLRGPRHRCRDQRAHQQPGERRVAVGEVHRPATRPLATVVPTRQVGEHAVRGRLEMHAAEPRLPRLPGEQRRQRVGPDREAAVAGALEEPRGPLSGSCSISTRPGLRDRSKFTNASSARATATRRRTVSTRFC